MAGHDPSKKVTQPGRDIPQAFLPQGAFSHIYAQPIPQHFHYLHVAKYVAELNMVSLTIFPVRYGDQGQKGRLLGEGQT